ncbi:NAD(P)/FAD-dependent oxidoreductase [Micromonospora sp. KC606]|uniref:FAD-dependent oxidoreductase n=1 Tax=Micromonospora sp. KC606 TaxID=2530379 RepID=UPI00104BD6C5|nr:FAD-dependent oxidoreductase [Micromonospora sp. KC606]TDC84225.1 NAD(P)/FAD-dependent oxidoreductase [Micromonospora sp. KC606]
MTRLLIVGNGPAAHRFVGQAHRRGYRGTITVLGAEPVAAYNRVLLPSVLAGVLPPAAVALPGPPGTADVRLGVTAVAVDRRRRLVLTGDGHGYPYDHLVLATGARARVPAVAGLRRVDGRPHPRVRVVRALDDCTNLPAGRVVVLGAGVLGVEVAAALRAAGRAVSLVHCHPAPMNRQLDPAAGGMLVRHLESARVEVLLDGRAVEYRRGVLRLADGRRLPADVLLLCVGAEPDTRLARRAGLEVRHGVVVDARLRTSDPRISAIGDCAELDGVVAGRVTVAWEQADTLAAVLTGEPARHRPSRPLTRLCAGGVDVAAIGPTDVPDGQTVLLSDPVRGRYARVTLRHERVARAVVVGLPHAAAALTQLYDRDTPLPGGMLGLLLGAAGCDDPDYEMPAEAVICMCNNVTKQALHDAWHEWGARDVGALATATRATTGCGRCVDVVRRICEALR